MSTRSRLVTAGALVAVLALGRAVTGAAPTDDELGAPFLADADVGDTVALRVGDLEVVEVTGSTTLEGSSGVRPTSGVWVVATIRFEARDEPTSLGYAAVVGTDGTTYEATGRSDLLLSTSQPGVAVVGTVSIELPPEAVPGARLRLAASFFDQRLDSMADVDLGLDQDDVDGFLARADPVLVPEPYVEAAGS